MKRFLIAVFAGTRGVLSSSAIKLLASVIVAVLLLEAVSAGVMYGRYTWARDPINTDFIEGFWFQRTFLKPFFRHRYETEVPSCSEIIDLLLPYPWEAKQVFPPDPVYGHRLGRSVCFRRKGTVMVTNDQGFSTNSRTPKTYSLVPEADTYRVVVMGGSTVMGMGALTPDINLPAYIERNIQAELTANGSQQRVEVINAGVGGYYSTTEFLYLAGELTRFSPDLVIVYDGWNDYQFRTVNLDQNFHNPSARQHLRVLSLAFSLLGGANILAGNAFETMRALAYRSSTLFLSIRAFRKAQAYLFPEASPAATPAEHAEMDNDLAISRYWTNLNLMETVAEVHEFDIAFFLQPIQGVNAPVERFGEIVGGISPDKVAFYGRARDLFGRLADKYRDAKNVCVADLSHSLDFVNLSSVYQDSGHLLGNGNRIVGATLVEHLSECGLLRSQ